MFEELIQSAYHDEDDFDDSQSEITADMSSSQLDSTHLSAGGILLDRGSSSTSPVVTTSAALQNEYNKSA